MSSTPSKKTNPAAGLEEISLGDFVLSGGELPAMVLIDAVVRLLPGALGDAASAHEDSFSAGARHLLDHPHYTRPPAWEGRDVPAVLMNGHHADINTWRTETAHHLTRTRRPDLLGLTSQPGRTASAPLVVVRDAGDPDRPAIDTLHRAAFPTAAEADLVTQLLDGHDTPISIVAEQTGPGVVGHVLLSIMRHEDEPAQRGLLALGPIAVHPDHQRRGIGRALVREAIRQAKDARAARLFVLGDPAFYGPLGFQPAADHGFTTAYDAAGPAVQTLDLGVRRPLPPGRVRLAQRLPHLFRPLKTHKPFHKIFLKNKPHLPQTKTPGVFCG